jgi:hypothetical protein
MHKTWPQPPKKKKIRKKSASHLIWIPYT